MQAGNGLYSGVQPPQVNRQLLPVKPLRIVIIRHAERADAVLGSDWSKKSFDRAGRYIRFSEHLPDAYVFNIHSFWYAPSQSNSIGYRLVRIYITMSSMSP